MAKMMLKTTICSTSPSAIAWMTDVGHDVEQDLIPGLAPLPRSRALPPSAGSTRPTPGRMTLTASRPMTSASVVTTSK